MRNRTAILRLELGERRGAVVKLDLEIYRVCELINADATDAIMNFVEMRRKAADLDWAASSDELRPEIELVPSVLEHGDLRGS
jgi:hypothetical protein